MKKYEIRNSSGKFYFSFSVDAKEAKVIRRRIKDLSPSEISLMEDIIAHLKHTLFVYNYGGMDGWLAEQKTKFDMLTNNWVL